MSIIPLRTDAFLVEGKKFIEHYLSRGITPVSTIVTERAAGALATAMYPNVQDLAAIVRKAALVKQHGPDHRYVKELDTNLKAFDNTIRVGDVTGSMVIPTINSRVVTQVSPGTLKEAQYWQQTEDGLIPPVADTILDRMDPEIRSRWRSSHSSPTLRPYGSSHLRWSTTNFPLTKT
jgi:hypothetical protein